MVLLNRTVARPKPWAADFPGAAGAIARRSRDLEPLPEQPAFAGVPTARQQSKPIIDQPRLQSAQPALPA